MRMIPVPYILTCGFKTEGISKGSYVAGYKNKNLSLLISKLYKIQNYFPVNSTILYHHICVLKNSLLELERKANLAKQKIASIFLVQLHFPLCFLKPPRRYELQQKLELAAQLLKKFYESPSI